MQVYNGQQQEDDTVLVTMYEIGMGGIFTMHEK
jgi:hypothetical protein